MVSPAARATPRGTLEGNPGLLGGYISEASDEEA